MTKEEIKYTPEIVDYVISESLMEESKEKLRIRLDEICNLAIKALEQDSCEDMEREYEKAKALFGKVVKSEDCISRKAVLDAFWKLDVELTPSAIDAILDMVNSLPPVNPQEPKKTGHWIKIPWVKVIAGHQIHTEAVNMDEIMWSECSNCGNDESGYPKRMKYCPNCGSYNGSDNNGNE